MGDNFTVSSQASRLLGMARSVEFFGRSPFWPIAFLADRLFGRSPRNSPNLPKGN